MSNHRAFTLIELLVVVAIIGILAAVGVVAYNGYTGAAKKRATEANHKIIVKYMQNETFKCEIDSSSEIMNLNGKNLLKCSDLVWDTAKVTKVTNAMKSYFDDKNKNVYDSNLSAINFGRHIRCFPSGKYKNYGGQGEHHITVGWVDINQNSNWKLNFFLETCLESSGSALKKQYVVTQ